ncbi:hypothetical protein ACM9HB_34170 [Streptomyces sp. JAC128]|uniref:hypothetical protein n=1 Tax=Streptomyces sp. JAC128 TaxID=3418412 RepID=UPI003D815002
MTKSALPVADIKGFDGKRVADLKLSGQGGWTVLAGPNSSGKSTLLQNLALTLVVPVVARGP